MNGRRRWTLAIFLFTIGDALALQVRGALVPSLQAAFDVSPALLGLVAPAGTVGFLLAILVVGTSAGRLQVRRTVLGALAVATVTFVAMGVAPVYLLFLGFLVVQGSADGVVRGLDRPILAHFYPEQRGRVFNVYALVWALGAATAPLLVNAALAVGTWRWVFFALALVFLPAAFLLARADPPSLEEGERSLSWADFRALLSDWRIVGVVLALVCSGSIEGSIFTWLPYYANGFLTPAQANLLLSGFLVSYIPGRAVYSVLVERVDPLALVVVLSLCCVPTLYVAFTATDPLVVVGAVLLTGLFISGLFPTVSAFGVDVAPAYSGPVNAIATAGNYAGLSLAPAAVGVAAARTDIGAALSGLAGVAVAFALVTGTLRLHVGRSPDTTPAE
ncbi:MFS transporter [Halarchaeum sp. P4]|uniref:MFS transporter n=1 Tax=Halarchaeum sp. P4 TaxID=3421639 RepID=UPI003EB8FC87